MQDESIREFNQLQEKRKEPFQVAESIWTKLKDEKLDQSWGQASKIPAQYNFPELKLGALGLAAISNSEFCLYSGTASANLSQKDLPDLDLDGSHFARIGDSSGLSIEVHWGKTQDQRYTMAQRQDKSSFGSYIASDGDGRQYIDYHYRFANGWQETIYHVSSNSSEPDHPRKLLLYKEENGTKITGSMGTHPSDKFAIFSKGNTEFSIALDSSGESSQNFALSKSENLKNIRTQLLEATRSKHTDGWTQAKLKVNMMRLESSRLPQIEECFFKGGAGKTEAKSLAEDEIAGTYKQALRLLQNQSKLKDIEQNPNIPQDRLATACAEQIIEHAANPTEITQGEHPTCTLASLESRIYTRYPAKAARLVADLAIEGEYIGSLGTKAELDSNSLLAHSDSRFYVTQDGDRGIASQIFEVGAANLIYAKEKQDLKYSQGEPKSSEDSGDILSDKAGKEICDYPKTGHNWLLDIGEEISGKKEASWIIRADTTGQNSDRSIQVNCSKDLEKVLADAARTGNFPLAAHVYTDHEPLYTESGDRAAHQNGGAHLLSISAYHPGRTKAVDLDNQWSANLDHSGARALSIDDTLHLMKNPFWTRLFRSFCK